MQEINLLQNKLKDQTHQWEKNNRLMVVVLAIILAVVVAGAAFFYFKAKSALDSKTALDQQNVDIKKQLDKMESQMDNAVSFQAQSKNISSLLKAHIAWTGIINNLSSSTSKTTQFMNMNSDTSGKITVEGFTPTYTDLGKLLLALETSDQLTSVKLISTTPASGAAAGVIYSLELQAKQSELISQN